MPEQEDEEPLTIKRILKKADILELISDLERRSGEIDKMVVIFRNETGNMQITYTDIESDLILLGILDAAKHLIMIERIFPEEDDE